ncbi:MAG: WecB/TagA/CpsF family glycosyltransferase [Vulcanimicrobiota bacterium]
MKENPEKGRIFGLNIHRVTLDETMELIDNMVKQGGAHLVVTLGVEMIMRAQNDPEFANIVNEASLVVPDSVGVLWSCKKGGFALKERVPGVDILYSSARNREKYPWKVFFLGAKPGTAERAKEKIEKEFPGYQVVGTHHGYFREDREVIDIIRDANPDILFIALGSPFQEKWFMKNRHQLGDIVALGVGGSLDVVSGEARRAPVFFQKMGLEWFYRLVTQPARFKRMLVLPAFAIKVLIEGTDNK